MSIISERKDIKIDSVLFGKYRIIKLLGEGGTSDVYLAEHLRLHTCRAIKCISKTNTSYRFSIRETEILKSLKHPSIPVIYDIEEDEQYIYIIEEFITGISLKAFRREREHIPESLIIDFSKQICELIHFLHSSKEQILYLDLKPDNIMISGTRVKLIDFGSAVFKQSQESLYHFGTAAYAAPEQYRMGKLDERADIYGIGMIIYYMAAGENFLKDNGRIKDISKISGYSFEMEQIITRCLEYNPVARFSCVKAVYKKLSEMENNNKTKSGQSLTVGVAGSQQRIGTTHISFLICSYLNHYLGKSIYVEENQSHTALAVKSRYRDIFIENGVCRLKDCVMLLDKKDNQYLKHCTYIIKDYGKLTNEFMEDFLADDIKILILGAKEWELEEAEHILKSLRNHSEIHYLFNFTDSSDLKEIGRNMKGLRYGRIPYIRNYFEYGTNQEWLITLEKIFKQKLRKEKGLKNLCRRMQCCLRKLCIRKNQDRL